MSERDRRHESDARAHAAPEDIARPSAPVTTSLTGVPRCKAGAGAGAGPGSSPSADDGRPEAELDAYLRQYADGTLPERLHPLAVCLPPLPSDAPPAMRAVYDDFRLVRGLLLALCDDRPVPYGAGWVAARVGLGKGTVSRARERLVREGILEFVGELPARAKPNGTKTYLPGKGTQ